MELADSTLIDSLVSAIVHPPRKPRRCGVQASTKPGKQSMPVDYCAVAARCTCGVCRKCQENARWERIFAEKFADPDYYSDRQIRHVSSLCWD